MKKRIYFLVIIFIFFGTKAEEHSSEKDQCSASQKDCATNYSNLYSKESNLIYEDINNALKVYQECLDENCECFSKEIFDNLKPFVKNGIKSASDIQNIKSLGTKYQIIQNKLYRERSCMFPARCSGIEYYLKPLLKYLPDIEFIINTRDWPQQPKNYRNYDAPVFSFSKTSDYLDIMYPAWSFREGGPAISLYPSGIGRWDLHREKISKIANETFPWEKKKTKGFFRGSRTSDERDSLILLSRRAAKLVDAQYTKNQAWKSPKDTLNAEPATEVKFEDHCKYKFLFNFRGVAASFRFKHLFLCKSLVFHVGNEYQEFFYGELKPWIHYVPLPSYPKEEKIRELINFFKDNDNIAKEISERGFSFIWNHLNNENIQCYWKKLLIEYGKLIKYNVKLDKELIEIK